MVFGDVLGGAGGAAGGLVGLAAMGPGGRNRYRQAIGEWEDLEGFLPEYDMADVPAPHLQFAGEMEPQLYDANVPQELALMEDSPEARQQQTASLNRLGMYRDEGLPMLDRVRALKTQRMLQDEVGRQFDAGRASLAARGRLSGGLGSSLGAARGQTAADLARDMGEDLIAQQIQQQYRATLAADEAASRLRQQDMNLSGNRADATNRFNEMVSNMYNQASQANQQQRGAAEAYNVGNQQRLGEQNQLNQYNARLNDIDRQNQLRGQSFQDRFSTTAGKTGALQDYGRAKYGEQAAKLHNISQIGRGLGQSAGGALDFAFMGGK